MTRKRRPSAGKAQTFRMPSTHPPPPLHTQRTVGPERFCCEHCHETYDRTLSNAVDTTRFCDDGHERKGPR